MINLPPAFVLGCHYNGLSLIRSLGRRGVPVFAVDTHRAVGTYSRYATFLESPDPHVDEDGFVDWLLKLAKGHRGRKPVLLPTNDGWAAVISKKKGILDQYFSPCVAEWPTVRRALYKKDFYAWALQSGYPVPKVYLPEEIVGRSDIHFPVLAKPEYRRMSSGDPTNAVLQARLDAIRFVLLHEISDLDTFLSRNRDLLPYVLFQEFVPGLSDAMYTVGLYADRRHEVRALFTGHKVRGYPFDHGDCMVGESVPLPDPVVDVARRLVADLSYTGIAEVEFKLDARSGAYRLIEVNPRSWSWIGITGPCGVDIPWIAYADMAGLERPSFQRSACLEGEVKFVRILDDPGNCLIDYRKAGVTGPLTGVSAWMRSLKCRRLVFAEFDGRDFMPGAIAFWRLTRTWVRRIGRRGCRLLGRRRPQGV